MQQYSSVVQDANGNGISGASVTVTRAAGGAATLYSGNGTGLLGSNVVTTDPGGNYAFYAANGRYTLTITASGFTTQTRDVVLFDPSDDRVNVFDRGVIGNGVADDTVAFQAAVNAAIAARKVLYVPAHDVGQYIRTSAPIVANGPLEIVCDGPFGTTLYGVGLTAGQYVLDFDCLDANQVEHVRIQGLTIRSDNGAPHGLRLKNVAQVVVEQTRLYGLVDGINIEGTRCYTHRFSMVSGVSITGRTVEWLAGFSGGGQFIFDSCTFLGAEGAFVPSTAFLDNLSFYGCNFEQCTSGVVINGTVAGFTFSGSRTEGNDAADIILRPVLSSEYVGGIDISGNVFSASDASATARISIGGDAGKVRGFAVTGNVVTHGSDAFGGPLVSLNGDGESGIIAGNFLRGTIATAVSGWRSGVAVYSNENLAGKLPEVAGMTGTYTATATGMTTSPTGTVKYTAFGGMVVLDIPAIVGTSNSTAFTLTGMPSPIRPAVDKDVLVRIQDNGAAITSGYARIKTTGVIEVYASPNGAAFTSSGQKAISTNSISYTLA
jgi:hypothetical protein